MKKLSVTATSFLKSPSLKNRLLETFPKFAINFPESIAHYNRDRMLSSIKDSSFLIVGKERVDDHFIRQLPSLEVISKYGVGLDNIDFSACRKYGVEVLYTEGVNSGPVAELTLGLMISLSRNIMRTDRMLRADNTWEKNGGKSLCELKVAIVGCGHVGEKVARLCHYLGSELLLCDIKDKQELAIELNARQTSLLECLQQADILSFHVPLTNETKYMFNHHNMKETKKGLLLINTSRGKVVNEHALIEALHLKQVAGAALDVYEVEPMSSNELFAFDNVITTPHIGGNSHAAVWAMGLAAIANLREFLFKRDSKL